MEVGKTLTLIIGSFRAKSRVPISLGWIAAVQAYVTGQKRSRSQGLSASCDSWLSVSHQVHPIMFTVIFTSSAGSGPCFGEQQAQPVSQQHDLKSRGQEAARRQAP